MTYNYSSGAFDLYTNGINVNTTYASTMTPGTDLFIGSQIDVFERANGSIDDIMIFNKKLNDSEVATLGDLKKYRYQYRYLYLNITQRRADAYKMQIGELELFKYGTNVNIPHPYILQSISTPGSSSDGGQGPDKLIDGTSTTKYLGGNWPVGVYGSSNITIDLGRMLEFNQYRFLTADDDPTRDPVSWTLWGSVDNVAYVLLDNVTAATITSSRQTATQLFNITG
jgi:hypothetical protein